jgi:hypothetical protein
MKPTRNIVKPSGMWQPKGKVWFQKNDDGDNVHTPFQGESDKYKEDESDAMEESARRFQMREDKRVKKAILSRGPDALNTRRWEALEAIKKRGNY